MDGALTVCLNRVDSRSTRKVNNGAIKAHGGEWNGERTVSIEVDAFKDGFRLRSTIDDVEPLRGEYIRVVERLIAANLRSALL